MYRQTDRQQTDHAVEKRVEMSKNATAFPPKNQAHARIIQCYPVHFWTCLVFD